MKQKTARIISLSIIFLFAASLFSWSTPVSAGVSEWTAETIPGRLDNSIGPPGIDVRDFAIGNDDKTVYAVPGNSIAGNVVYKSINAGVSWTALTVSIRADLVAIAPDDVNIIAIANNSTPEVNLSIDGGVTWYALGTPQALAGAPAAAIFDIAISGIWEKKHFIAAAGQEAGNVGNLWYFAYGAAAATWQETNTLPGATAESEVAAIDFSDSFSSDATLVAVTDSTGVDVKLQVLNIDSLKWNGNAGYIGYPCTVVSNAGINRLTSASLTLSPGYDGSDEGSRDLFIGLTIDGTAPAIAASGIYRFSDIIKTDIVLNAQIHSVAFNGSYLIAGVYNTNTVYRVLTPLVSTFTVKLNTTTKGPGGDNRVTVAWMGGSVIAGTWGNESAFSISKDSGTTFNDISLIDTVLTNATDVAVSTDGSKVYFVTDDSVDLSLWRKADSAWMRVLSLKGTTDCIVRVDQPSANAIYLAPKNSRTIYYSNSSGTGQWQTRNCNIWVQDIAVESALVAYVLNAAGLVSKSIDGGYIWAAAMETTLDSGGMLVSVSSGKLLAGSLGGFVAYSLDGNQSWTKISQGYSIGVGKMHVVADQNFATNKTIYVASESPGQNILKWQIDVSTDWTDIFMGTIPGGVYGLAVDSNTLYALEYNAITQQSTLWRYISPTTATSASQGWTGISTTATTDIDDPTVRFNAAPQALKASTGKLWAAKTNGVNKLYSFSDSAVDITLTLLKPASGFSVHVNALTGVAYDIPFSWYRPSVATEYELRISLDPDFTSLVASLILPSEEPVVFVIIGPHQLVPRRVEFAPGTIYYWKIRTTKPGYSLYSATREFTVEPSLSAGSEQMVPANGVKINTITPAFSWQPLAGVTEYEFMLSESVDMSSPLVDAKVDGAGILIARKLEYGKTYFWRVRAARPIVSEWSALAIFVVAEEQEEPIPAVIVREPPPVIIVLPETPPETIIKLPPPVEPPVSVSPGYLRGAIIILSVLAATAIVLIFVRPPARLLPAIHLPESLLGLAQRVKAPARKPVMPREKPVTPAVVPKPTKPAGEKPVTPAAVPKPVRPTGERTARPPAVEKSKEAEAVIFAAKSFMWIADTEKETAESHPKLSLRERDSLGKHVTAGIRDLSAKELFYARYPEDAAMLLRIWSQYGSRDETNRYLLKSFKTRPDNAIRLIKCYLPAAVPPEKDEPAAGFTRDSYKALTEVIDPDKVYAALTKVFKFKLDAIEETTPVKPTDRNIAFKFMRVHHQVKSEK